MVLEGGDRASDGLLNPNVRSSAPEYLSIVTGHLSIWTSILTLTASNRT